MGQNLCEFNMYDITSDLCCSLVLPANIEELVNYITQEPSDDTDEKVRYK